MPTENKTGEASYLQLLRDVLDHGERRADRTGTGTLSLFGAQIRFDLREGFPLLTTKRVNFSPIVHELLWFLRGSTSIADLETRIWDAWADERGDLGPIYGHQWRSWGAQPGLPDAGDLDVIERDLDAAKRALADVPCPEDAQAWWGRMTRASLAIAELRMQRSRCTRSGIDQISEALETIKRDPSSRRIVVSAWNVADLPRMRLPPCHVMFQFYVHDGYLDCQLYQRSADLAIGVPFNIASYALLTEMFARECGLRARYFIHTFGDAHIYLNHVDGVQQQLTRDPLRPPTLRISDRPVLAQRSEDISIGNYEHHPPIRFEVSV
jgi:thymidylate synthase